MNPYDWITVTLTKTKGLPCIFCVFFFQVFPFTFGLVTDNIL